jgi:hypothetical protein
MTPYTEEDDGDGDGHHRFLLSWDDLGIEMVFDIDAERSKKVEAALKDEPYVYQDPGSMLEKARLRARFNTPRNYEIYAIAMPDHLSEEKVRDMFDNNFETMCELIRKKGLKLY